jgi:hypothetical protein
MGRHVRRMSSHGRELRVFARVLPHWLLRNLLLDRGSAVPRIWVVAQELRTRASLLFELFEEIGGVVVRLWR